GRAILENAQSLYGKRVGEGSGETLMPENWPKTVCTHPSVCCRRPFLYRLSVEPDSSGCHGRVRPSHTAVAREVFGQSAAASQSARSDFLRRAAAVSQSNRSAAAAGGVTRLLSVAAATPARPAAAWTGRAGRGRRTGTRLDPVAGGGWVGDVL